MKKYGADLFEMGIEFIATVIEIAIEAACNIF